MYKCIFKNILDFLCAFFALLIFAPILLIVFLLLLVSNKGKVFFVQTRPGSKGKPFKIIKFKTMNDKRDTNGVLLADAERLTLVGKFIRNSSLDELPQLINVLKGDISLVGPRPLLMEYIPLYNEEQTRRHEVKPGITGWAQVNGRNAISWEEKFRLDVEYVDNLSFKLDVKILMMTIKKVIIKEGISADNHATMEFFKGTK
ncbi:MAG: sugar transferase [Marinifilaceae bacterium]